MTSVESLFHQLWECPKDKLTWYSILSQAKEMHKQEIVDAYEQGQSLGFDDNPNYMAGQYYQETFVKD